MPSCRPDELPHDVEWLEVRDVDTMIDAIRRLAVRGAPAIGVAGGFAVALAALEGRGPDHVRAEAARIAAARPTAVNLSWAVRRVVGRLTTAPTPWSPRPSSWPRRTCARTGPSPCAAPSCSRGCGEPGPRAHPLQRRRAGVRRVGHRARHRAGDARAGHAGVGHGGRTRPLLQGARLTAFELVELGIEHRIVVDGAGPSVIARGWPTPSSSAPTASPPTATWPTRSARTRSRCRGPRRDPVRRGRTRVDARPGDGDGRRHRDRGAVTRGGARRRRRRVAPAGSGALNPAFDVRPPTS